MTEFRKTCPWRELESHEVEAHVVNPRYAKNTCPWSGKAPEEILAKKVFKDTCPWGKPEQYVAKSKHPNARAAKNTCPWG